MVDPTAPPHTPTTDRLVSVNLDEGSIARGSSNIDHEREVAIYDLIDQNTYRPMPELA